MSALAVARLGSKENPHPILPKKIIDRIPGHYYINKKDKLLNNKFKSS